MTSTLRLPRIERRELPAPSDGTRYSQLEVIELSFTFKKSTLIKAIHESDYEPKLASLYKFFPSTKSPIPSEIVKSLLRKYSVGSEEWQRRVSFISNIQHGTSEKDIYDLLGVVKKVTFLPRSHKEGDDLDDELDAINQTIISASMAASSETSLRCITPDVEMTTADTSITNRSNKKRKLNTADLIQSNACVSIKDAMRILKEEVESNGSSDEMKALARILLMDSAQSAAEKKAVVRKAAAAIIAPRFNYGGDIEKIDWSLSEEGFSAASKTNDVKNLRASLITTTKANARRAAAVLNQFLNDKNNELVMRELDELRSTKRSCSDSQSVPEAIAD
eukprot:scaffold6336_cov57-Cyclotella_meneghiniana.AAC.1